MVYLQAILKMFSNVKHNIPRWVIFVIDVIIVGVCLLLAYLLRFNFIVPPDEMITMPLVFTIVISVRSISFLVARTYAGIIRYTSTKDIQRIFTVVTSGTVVFALINLCTYFTDKKFYLPFSILLIEYLATMFTLIAGRVLIKVMYFELKNVNTPKTKVVIFGAGESGIIAKRTLDRDAGTKYKVIAFLDDDKQKIGKKLEGVYIYHTSKLDELLQENDIAHVILSVQNLPAAEKQVLVEKCFPFNTKVLNVPPATKWINGELSFKQIKRVNIEDLLERDPIVLDKDRIRKQLKDKVVLVTGGAGSIGSELARQVVKFNPKKLILLDQAESAIYDIELELLDKIKSGICEVVIGDIRNHERMENVFKTFKPDVVYHAAAYKHVPMMENNPSEAVLTNVGGTKVIADLAVKYKVNEFVMVSTDKAVNPTNIMGASKRIAEIYTQALSKTDGCTTRFITTRFGNVLGSNGSVIPVFRRQIEQGGPITITHPEITRYFMTIPEACQLVLEAGAMGKGGEIFIFDMGKSVKIVDLAKKMIRLSGLTLGKDIQIVFTGLRPGEKLYEELLNNQENTIKTHHKQIMIARVKEYDFNTVSTSVNQLVSLFPGQDNISLVRKMKEIVPEFRSNNSVYEDLDREVVPYSSRQ